MNLNQATFIGSYEKVAGMLDEVAELPKIKGIMLTFDDFLVGLDAFGKRIQPLMKCRKHIKTDGVQTPVSDVPEVVIDKKALSGNKTNGAGKRKREVSKVSKEMGPTKRVTRQRTSTS